MFKEVAINPECMAHSEYFDLIMLETGYEKGRYLVADMKAWADEAYPYAKNADMRPRARKRVTNFLNKLKKNRRNEHFACPGDRQIVCADCWLDWWGQQCARREFDATLSDDRRDRTICFEDVLDGAEGWEVTPSLTTRRNAIDIVAIIEPLLNMSKELLIVDQYFSFSSNATFTELCRLLQKCSSLNSVHLVTSVESSDPRAAYANDYEGLIPFNVRLTVTIVPERFVHDRYMITDVGALKAGHGWSEATEQGALSDQLGINLVSKAEAAGVQQALFDAKSAGKAKVIFTNF